MLYCTYFPSYVGIPVSVTSFSIPSFSISLSLYELFFLTHTFFFFFFLNESETERERERVMKSKEIKKLKSMCWSKVGEWESFNDFCAVLVGTDRVSQRLEMEWKLMEWIPGRGHLSNMLFFFSFGLKFEWKGKGQKDLNSLIL